MKAVKAPTQRAIVLYHLERYGSIEPLEALYHYGIYRLGARIKELRDAGIPIVSERIHLTNKHTGRPMEYARYHLRTTTGGGTV